MEQGGGGMSTWQLQRTPYESEIDIVSDGRVIATVEAGEDKEEIAQMIVSAPDMLEALENCLGFVVAHPHFTADLRNLIAKARGES